MLELDVRYAVGSFRLDAAFAASTGLTALFGRSGAGKSTILDLIAGLRAPASGRVVLGGRPLFDAAARLDVPAHQRRVGYVFQDARLLPHLAVRRNLGYGRYFARRRAPLVGFDEAVDLLGLEHLLDRRVQTLSGGEKQRVAIGRALLANPEALLLDEPLASLDTPRKTEILYYVERLRDELRIPIVYVSHSIDEIVRLADTLVVIADGRVQAAGAMSEMFARPELRPYLGIHDPGAVIEARVVEQDLDSGLARLAFGGLALEVADVAALVGEQVRVRIRARDVSVALVAPQGVSIRNALPGVVRDVHLDDAATTDVRLDVGGTPLVARITRKSAEELGLVPGRRVFALVKSVSIDRRSTGYV